MCPVGRGFGDGTAALRHCPPLVVPELQLESRFSSFFGVILGRYEQNRTNKLNAPLEFGIWHDLAPLGQWQWQRTTRTKSDQVQESLAACCLRFHDTLSKKACWWHKQGRPDMKHSMGCQWVNEPKVSKRSLAMITIRYNWPLFFRL